MISVYFSYDYELLWGVWRRATDKYIETNVAQGNSALAAILTAHQNAKIPASIAVIGALFDDTKMVHLIDQMHEGDPWLPRLLEIDAKYGHRTDLLKTSAWLKRVLSTHPQAVLGSHSHAHCFALDCGDGSLVQDFERQDRLFQDYFARRPEFLIMPKNQVTQKVWDLMPRFGFVSVRVNPLGWLYDYKRSGRLIRLLRFADSFLPISEFLCTKRAPASTLEGRFFFRPANKFRWLDTLHLFRLKVGFVHAQRTKRDFHIWAHPHNFGGDVERSVNNLKRLMRWLKAKEARGDIQFCRMDQTVSRSVVMGRCTEKQAI